MYYFTILFGQQIFMYTYQKKSEAKAFRDFHSENTDASLISPVRKLRAGQVIALAKEI